MNWCLKSFGLRGGIVVMAIIAALPAFGALVWSAVDAYRVRRDHALEHAHLQALSIADRIQDVIDATERSLAAMAKFDAADLMAKPRCGELLAAGAWIAGPDGKVICDFSGQSAIDRSDRPDFIDAVRTGKFSVGALRIAPISGSPVIPVSLPVFNDHGVLIAVIGTAISVDHASFIFRQYEFPPGAAVDLVARNGSVLLGWSIGADGSGEPTNVTARDTHSYLVAFPDLDSSSEALGPDGISYFTAVAHLPSGELAIVARYPAPSMLMPARKAALILGLAAIVALLTTIGVVAWATSFIVLRPIRRLTSVAASISGGDPAEQLASSKFVDDFALLARSFDDMADRIKMREKSIQSAESHLIDAIDSIPIAFSIWDADDRLVRVNREIHSADGGQYPIFVPGKKFSEIFERLLPFYSSLSSDEADSYATKRRMQREAGTGEPFEFQSADGHWYEFRERRMSDGGMVSTRIDVTGRKIGERERELERYILKLVSPDRSLQQVLVALCSTFEREVPSAKCIIICRDGKQMLHAAPSLPPLPESVIGDFVAVLMADIAISALEDAAGDEFIEKLTSNARNYFAQLDLKSFNPYPLFDYGGESTALVILCGSSPLIAHQRRLAARLAKLAEAAIMRTIAITALRNSEIHLKSIMENTAVGLFTFDQNMMVTSFNGAASTIFGIAREEITANSFLPLMQESSRGELSTLISEHLRTGRPVVDANYQIDGIRKGGSSFPIGLHIAEIPVGGECREFLATVHDATESKRAEARLRRGQKMEAVGQLTGGVAHEFNNLLAVILSDLEALNDGDLSDEDYNECLSSALGATRKGADVIHRLLTFSKRQTLRPGPVVVNDLVGNMAKLIGRNFGQAIAVDFRPGEDIGQVCVDAGQLESAIVNLAVNARDAMPTGGRISISTNLVDWNPKYDRTLSDLPRGVYVQISVCDTGVGMSPDIVARAIEPFFTTKEFGRGSGLGLSIAYGFASQSGGTVDIRSAVGHGTTVAILLPKELAAQELLPVQSLAELEM